MSGKILGAMTIKLDEALKQMSLYAALKLTDKINDRLETHVTKFNEGLKEYQRFEGYVDICIQQTPNIEKITIQCALVDAKKGNYFLDSVLRGEDTFAGFVKELYNAKHTGWRRFVPLREDKEYNQKIKELGEILRTDFEVGFFNKYALTPMELTKPLSSGGMYGICGGLIGTMMGYSKGGALMLGLTLGFGFGLMGFIWGGMIGIFADCAAHERYTDAQYLDEKLKELAFVK